MAKTDQNMSRLNAETNLLSSPISHNRFQWLSLAKVAENYPPSFPKMVLAEIIGTYLLVFVGSGSAALSAIDENKVSKLAASLAGGFIVTVMIYSIGHISGAHMNPAVSFAFAALSHFPWKQVPFYMAAQLTGAISASFTVRILLEPMKQLGTTTPVGTNIQALIIEIVATFTMMFITSAVATDAKAVGELAGVAVGFSVCITGILAGPISGGSMNPARTLGPAIASGSFKGIWVYVVGPVRGALLGAWSYCAIRETDKPVSKLHFTNSENEQVGNKDPLSSV